MTYDRIFEKIRAGAPSLLVAVFVMVLSACASIPPSQVPMPVVAEQPGKRADTLLIMLPGRLGRAEGFRDEGFFDLARNLGADLVAADAHFGYYRDRTLLERLHEDLILPAREQGYESIWLLGISMGGFGAKLYASEHPGMVDGLILLAPYPGGRGIVREIERAGGLDHWPSGSNAGRDYERELWLWLKSATRDPGAPVIYIGYGDGDRFASAARLLREQLPGERGFVTRGGHDWDTWRRLWEEMVTAGIL